MAENSSNFRLLAEHKVSSAKTHLREGEDENGCQAEFLIVYFAFTCGIKLTVEYKNPPESMDEVSFHRMKHQWVGIFEAEDGRVLVLPLDVE